MKGFLRGVSWGEIWCLMGWWTTVRLGEPPSPRSGPGDHRGGLLEHRGVHHLAERLRLDVCFVNFTHAKKIGKVASICQVDS